VNGFLTFLVEMLPIKQAIKRRFTMPNQVTCASALPGQRGNAKIAFSPQMLYYCIAWIQPAAWLLRCFWLTTHNYGAIITLLSLVINALS